MARNVRWRGKQVKAKVVHGMERNLLKAGFILAGDIRDAFPSSGADGTRSGGGDASNASAPGEIPHVQTAHLKRNIGVARTDRKTVRVGTGVGNKDSVGYAVALELGRADGTMEPRPFMRPGLKRSSTRRKIKRAIGVDVI